MTRYTCPTCGAPGVFQSSASTFAVCAYCRATLVRTDRDVEAIGKMAELQEDASPLQLTTTGEYKGQAFIVLGRVRVEWEDGAWNEWFLRFNSDGREAWLAEAQGQYMMSFESSPTDEALETFVVGSFAKIDSRAFEVTDVKHVTYTYAEGELPFAAPEGTKAVSIDLTRGERGFATVSFESEGASAVYLGEVVEFDELKLTNLRAIDGW